MRRKFLLFIFILACLLVLRFYFFYQSQPQYQNGQLLWLAADLREEPEFGNRGQRFSVRDGYNRTIYVTAEAFPRFHYGQVLEMAGTVKLAQMDDGRELVTLQFPRVALKDQAANPVAGTANDLRRQSKEVFEQTLPPVPASLLMGIVFGAKEQFPLEFFQALQTTGVLHVIAASGMNVTFVAAALIFTLGTFLRRQIALVVGALGIVFYVFLVGFEPSILRASIMALLAFGASILGRQHFAAFAVLVSAYVLLFWQPGFLFSLGFQLSFLATLGIIFIKPILDERLFQGKRKVFEETITTTLAAQIATTPLLLGVFGKIGTLALLVNALVLWMVPVLMTLGSLAAIVNLFLPVLAKGFLLVCLPFLWLFETVVTFFGKSGAVWELTTLPWTLIAGYYLILAAIVLGTKPKVKSLALEESLAMEKY